MSYNPNHALSAYQGYVLSTDYVKRTGGMNYCMRGTFYTLDMLPNPGRTPDIGSPSFKYKNLYVESVYADKLEGSCESASKLSSAKNIKITGAVIGEVDTDFSGATTLNTTVNHNHDSDYIKKTGNTSSDPIRGALYTQGAIIPATSGSVNLGSSTNRFRKLYVDSIDATSIGGKSSASSKLETARTITVSLMPTLQSDKNSGSAAFDGSSDITISVYAPFVEAAKTCMKSGDLILSNGTLLPQIDLGQDLGSSSQRWRTLYGTATSASKLSTSDVGDGESPIYFKNGVPVKCNASLMINAYTATQLQTARALKIGNTSKNFNGTSDLSWTLDEIGITNKNPTFIGYMSLNREAGHTPGKNSVALGGLCPIASGDYSVALGLDPKASGYGSFAEGGGSVASGEFAIALGNHNTSSGKNSTTIGGYGNSVTGEKESIIGGTNNIIQGAEYHCEDSVILGGRKNTILGGYRSIIIGGYDCQIPTFYGTADSGMEPLYDCTIFGGYNNRNYGCTSAVLGGCDNWAGDSSHDYSKYYVKNAMAIGGSSNNALGRNSVTLGGCHNIAKHNQVVIGHWNNSSATYSGAEYGSKPSISNGITTDTSSSNVADAFIIGNGSATSRSNALRIRYDGVVMSKGAYQPTGADYAEYFEWEDGNPNGDDRRGYFVTFGDGDKIRIASSKDEYVLGIVSGNPSVIGNSDEHWRGQYELDEFGAYIMEDVNVTNSDITVNEDGDVVKNETSSKATVYKVNKEYDESKEYTPRACRNEWDAIGMLGVISVRDDGTCKVNGYCTVGNGGIAIPSTDYHSGPVYRVIGRVTSNIIKVLFK